ncbi:hypothetical protein BU25DRAFT_411746 [Macroventuria anomochaeta]|uniref:Uncharacterized protein n=1 Tax=Macroventuria anomochaeta TaxID=301207 RepID=A0ACB6RWR5_9PLEO|nr:uncharacterized protein BU25DRAFT_411746 [Macroventuria anomochaeta]KAF2626341.1 hypothetical protein BU25DRAFT_411746 [Macroventuria anomochaeta]
MQDSSTSIICEFDYNSNAPNTYTVVCTALIVLFTFLLEYVAHSHLDCCNMINDDDDNNTLNTSLNTRSHEVLSPTIVDEQPRPRIAPQDDEPQVATSQPIASDQVPKSAQKKPPPLSDCCTCCLPYPSPNIRANRLIVAVFLYAVTLTAFIVRIHDINHPYIRPECQGYVWKGQGSIPEPNWWAVALLNILPFIAASFNLVRTVVDCFLVRWGQALVYDGGISGTCTWPPCIPLFLVYVVIKGVFAWPIAWMMGRPMSSVWLASKAQTRRRDDIEMQGDETRRLVDDVDGEGEEGEGSTDGPPAYNVAVHHQTPQGQGEVSKGGATMA